MNRGIIPPLIVFTFFVLNISSTQISLNQKSHRKLAASLLESSSHSHFLRHERQAERLYKERGGAWKLTGFRNLTGCPKAAKQFKTFQESGQHFAVVVTGAAEDNTEIHSFNPKLGCKDRLAVLPTRSAFDVEIVRTGELGKPGAQFRLIALEETPLAHPHKLPGSPVFTLSIDGVTGRILAEKREVMPTGQNPSCLASWDQFGVPQLAVCGNGSVQLFCASAGYFDLCGELNTRGRPHSVRHFRIHQAHYLAVAAQPGRDGSLPSEILRLNVKSGSYAHLQFLPTKAARDLCFFKLGSRPDEAEFYLLAVNQLEGASSHIYKWSRGRYEPFQAVSVPGATGCLAVQQGAPGDDGQLLALILSTPSGSVALQYDGWRFVQTVQYGQHALGPGVRQMVSYTSDDGQLFLAVANDNPDLSGSADNLFALNFIRSPPDGPPVSSLAYARNLASCLATGSRLAADPIGAIVDLYNRTVKKNDTVVRLGRVTFTKPLDVRQVETNQVDVKLTATHLGKEQILRLRNLTVRMDGLENRLQSARQRADGSIRNLGDGLIQGPVRLRSLVGTDLQAGRMDSTRINSADVDRLYSQAILPETDRIDSQIRVARLDVTKSVETEWLSGKPDVSYLQADEDFALDPDVTARVDGDVRVVGGHLATFGRVDGLAISPSEVLLRSGDQLLDWTLKVNGDVRLADKLDVELINGRNLAQLYEKALPVSANATISRPVFSSILCGQAVQVTGLVNGINLTELDEKGMKRSGDQVVTGQHSYQTAHLGRAELGGQLNGHKLPDDFIPVRSGDQLSVQRVQLTSPLTHFGRLEVTEEAAGLKVTGGRLALDKWLNKTDVAQPIVVTGQKRFKDVRSAGQVTSATINGRPLDHFETNSSRFGDPGRPVRFDKGLETLGHVQFKMAVTAGSILGVDLERLDSWAVELNSTEFPPRIGLPPVVMTDVLIDGDVSAGTWNGVPSSSFVTKPIGPKGPLILDSRKIFTNGLSVNRTFRLLYHLNGHNLTELMGRAIRLDDDQSIPGQVTIINDVDMVQLNAAETPFVALGDPGGPLRLSGRKRFDVLGIQGDWFVDRLNLTGQINEADVNSWSKDTLMKNRADQVIKAQKVLRGLTVNDAFVKSVDELEIDQLIDLVSKDRPVTLFSDLVINGSLFTDNFLVNGSVDGVDGQAPAFWLRYGADQRISGSIRTAPNVSLRAETYRQGSWIVDGVDLAELTNRSIRTDQSGSVGSLSFDRVVVEDLVVNGSVQHVQPTDLVLKSARSAERPVITGQKSFKAPLESVSLRIGSHLNGQDPEEKLCRGPAIPPQTADWLIQGNVTISGAALKAMTVNRLNLTELLGQLWLKDSIRTDVAAGLTFLGPVLVNGTLGDGPISNVDLRDLNRRAVQLDKPTIITAQHRFQAVQVNGTLSVDNLDAGRIGGVETGQLTDSSVLLRDVEQDVPSGIVFEDLSVSKIGVDGRVNGIDLSSAVVRNDRTPSVISGRKVVSSLTVKDALNLCPKCLLGGIDPVSWSRRAVLKDQGEITLAGPARLESMILQQPLILEGLLDGVQVAQDQLLTLTGDQTIQGRLTLSSLLPDRIPFAASSAHQDATEDFTVAGRFTNLSLTAGHLYDGVNLSRFYDQSIRRDAKVNFTEPVVLYGLVSQEATDSSSKSTIGDLLTRPWGHVFHHVAPSLSVPLALADSGRNLSVMTSRIKRVLTDQPLELKFFEEVPLDQLQGRSLPMGPAAVDAIFAWESPDGRMELCSYTEDGGKLFYSSSTRPILQDADVKAVASAPGGTHFAVAAQFDGRQSNQSGSIVFNQAGQRIQTIPTDFPMDLSAFFLPDGQKGNLSGRPCYVFAEGMAQNSSVYCLSSPGGSYELFQQLPTIDARLVAVGSNGNALVVAIGTAAHRGHGRVALWNWNSTSGRLEPWKSLVTLQFSAMDCICLEDGRCLLATVAPSKPAAIPGQVLIWGLSGDGPPVRMQRLTFVEPTDVKFARLPDGRLSLLVLQRTGVDNVLVFVWRNLLQFQHVTTVRVPGAQDLQRLASPSRLLLALSVSQPMNGQPPVRTFRGNFFGKLN